MAAIHKRRARSFLVAGPIDGVGHGPNGMGGIPSSDPVVTITVGDYTVILTVREYKDIVQRLDTMLRSNK